MKKNILMPVILAITVSTNLISQNSCPHYKTGQKLHYTRIDAPSIMDIPNVGLLTPKELKPVQQKFDADVKAGLLKGKEYKFDGYIGESFAGHNSSSFEIQFPTPTYTVSSYVICQNDTIFGVKNKTATPMKTPDGNIEGFIKQGIVIYPRNMKVGDALPVTVDYTAMLPKKMDFSYRKTVLDYVESTRIVTTKEYQGYRETNIWTSSKSYFKEVTVKSQATFQIAPTTTTYRYVEAEEKLAFNGKEYKAFKITTLLDTKSGDVFKDIETDAFEHKLLLNFINGYVKNKTDKNLRQDGTEWFIPELGLVVVAEVFDASGKSLYKSVLNSIE